MVGRSHMYTGPRDARSLNAVLTGVDIALGWGLFCVTCRAQG